MMRTFPDRTNKVTLPLVARADGSPITAGAVNFYLIDDDGPNAGKWFRGSDDSWQASEAIAGAGTHKADGHWQRTIEAVAWKNMTSYTLYAKESGDLHIPISTKVLCRYGAPFDYPSDCAVFVPTTTSDALRGQALALALIAAGNLSPGGAGLSASNHATVLLPPGRYLTGAGFTLPAYVDMIALHPMEGGHRSYSDVDEIDGTTSLEQYRPPKTELYSADADVTTLTIVGPDTLTRGFGVGQISGDATGQYHAVYYSDADPVGTTQDMMYYWHRAPSSTGGGNERYPVAYKGNVKGSSSHCIANACAWRLLKTGGTIGSEFSLTGWWLEAGGRSFGGDYLLGDTTKRMHDCFLDHCYSFGGFGAETYGTASFSGCSSYGVPISSTCVFVDTWNGKCGYGLGALVEGTFIRTFGEGSCYGATTDPSYPGQFDGFGFELIGGPNSCGGAIAPTLGKLSGVLVRSVVTGSTAPWTLEGATIDQCVLNVVTSDQPCVLLADSASSIARSTLLVVPGGTGAPIDAASALSVCAGSNVYNNQQAAPSGMGDDVTNTAAGESVYFADVRLDRDAYAGQDEWTVSWYYNDAPVASTITDAKIQVVQRADGTDLVALAAMTQIGATASFRYDEATDRVTPGEAVLVVATATIDGATRTWTRLIGRDG